MGVKLPVFDGYFDINPTSFVSNTHSSRLICVLSTAALSEHPFVTLISAYWPPESRFPHHIWAGVAYSNEVESIRSAPSHCFAVPCPPTFLLLFPQNPTWSPSNQTHHHHTEKSPSPSNHHHFKRYRSFRRSQQSPVLSIFLPSLRHILEPLLTLLRCPLRLQLFQKPPSTLPPQPILNPASSNHIQNNGQRSYLQARPRRRWWYRKG